MGRGRFYIPEEVQSSIQRHIAEAAARTRAGFLSACEDEDTMTGHFCGLLQIGPQRVEVVQSEINGEWKWSLDYTKFRGRGPKPSENHIGADGIFELILEIGGRTERKSLLFQAKLDLARDDRLLKQCVKLSTWREAACVVNFTSTKFEVFSLDPIIRSGGRRPAGDTGIPIEDYVGGEFVKCLVGDTELIYDARSHKLRWRAMSGEIVATRFNVKSRIALKVNAPRRGPNPAYAVDKEIPNDKIHNYRMQATEEEVLSVESSHSDRELASAKRSLSLAYHPDKFSKMDELYQEIAKRRQQEINHAYDEIRERRRKSR